MSIIRAKELAEYTKENIDHIIDEIDHIILGNYGEAYYIEWERVRNSRMNKNAWLYQQYGRINDYTQAEVNQAYNLLDSELQQYFNEQLDQLVKENSIT